MKTTEFTSRELVLRLYKCFTNELPQLAASINMQDCPKKEAVEIFVICKARVAGKNEIARIDYEIQYNELWVCNNLDDVTQAVFEGLCAALFSSEFKAGWG